ncbi:hypothetical protein [Myxococcus sp. Y35]|uniref:hypothetical protein n=1 Tax=Pseudomyxococcus flavus TaxID=3115648 RepID=UPI003CF2EF6F
MSPLSRLVASLATLALIAAACAGQQKPETREASSTIEEVPNEGGDVAPEVPAVQFNVLEAPEGFTVKMPGPAPQPQRAEAPLPKRTDKASLVTYATTQDNVTYLINTVDYPEAFVATVPAEALITGGIQGIAGQVSGELKSSEDITLDGYPGKAYVLASPSGEVKGRSYLVGPRIYNLIAVYNAAIGAPGADEFLNSLTLINPPPQIERASADADGGTDADAGTDAGVTGTEAAPEGGEDAGTAPDAGARRRRAK